MARRFASPPTYSRIAARRRWEADAIDLEPDARAWSALPDERRRRLTTLLAGFHVAEEAVSEQIEPFGDAAGDQLVSWVFFLQRTDESRHARFFDRVAAEVLGLPGDTPEERRAAARDEVPAAVLELFEEHLPSMASELAAGRTELGEAVCLYHLVLEGTVFAAGQRALLDELADSDFSGVRRGVQRVELDERWHIGFGLRCLVEAQPSSELVDDLVDRAATAATAWGDVVPDETREFVEDMCRRRLVATGLIGSKTAAWPG